MTHLRATNDKRFQVLSFDLDNALYDNRPTLAAAEAACQQVLQRAFELQGVVFDYQDFLTIRHGLLESNDPKFDNLSRMRLHALNLFCEPLLESQAVAERAFAAFMQQRSHIQCEPAIEYMLSNLAKEFTLVTASNGNCDLRLTPLGKYFDRHWSATLDFRAKPHPHMLEAIMTHYQIPAEKLLHIGDSVEKDGGAAQAVGVTFFPFAPFDAGADLEKTCQSLLRFVSS